MRRYLAGAEEIAREDFLVRRDVRRHANNREFVQSALHPRHRLVPVTTPRDHLREERVVIRRDLPAPGAARGEADTRPPGGEPGPWPTPRRCGGRPRASATASGPACPAGHPRLVPAQCGG